MERVVAHPFSQIVYCRYVDNIYNRCKINEQDDLYEALKKCHEYIKLALEKSPPNSQIQSY